MNAAAAAAAASMCLVERQQKTSSHIDPNHFWVQRTHLVSGKKTYSLSKPLSIYLAGVRVHMYR